MTRKTLFEFEDFDWLPSSIRAGITNLIIVFHRMMGTEEVLVGLIQSIHQKQAFNSIVDLGSGSGGPMPGVVKHLNATEEVDLKLILTDLHPDPAVVQKINQAEGPTVQYHHQSIDATKIEAAPAGLKTMIAAFHHLSPAQAKQLLHGAAKAKEPVLIYEVAKNNVPFPIWCLFLPLGLIILAIMTLFMTPFVKKLSLSQVFFTYLIPVIPIIYAWDGQASLMRTYTFDDIQSMIADSDQESYSWEVTDALNAKGKKQGYYILGMPAP